MPTDREPSQADFRAAHRFYAAGTDAEIPDAKPRARPVQREGAEQEALTRIARTRWWWPGYRHIEQARPTSARERARLKRRGVKPGTLDVLLMIPGRQPVVAMLELKAQGGRPTPDQTAMVELAHGCAVHAAVVTGHEAAIEWLDRVAGPRRDVPWPERPDGIDDWR